MYTIHEYIVLIVCGVIIVGLISIIDKLFNPNRIRNQANDLVIRQDKRTEHQRNVQQENLKEKESNGFLWILLIFALLYIIFS